LILFLPAVRIDAVLQMPAPFGNVKLMSMAEIINELPKLTHHQRRKLCRKIIELEAASGDIALCDETARQGFAMLDQMEDQDAKRA
jgi:hypothetical protein